jgi:hypothetical protein
MAAFRIPSSVQLHGLTIPTKYSDDLVAEDDCIGKAKYRTGIIVLQRRLKGVPFPRPQQEQTWCHELVHHILEQMGEEELRQNEKHVDLFAQLLHQALSTAKYDKAIK